MSLDLLLYVVYGVTVIALGTLAVTVCLRWMRVWCQNRHRACRLLWGMAAFAVLLCGAYGLASDAPLALGDAVYAQGVWLKLADMLLYAVYCLVGLAVVCVLCAWLGLFRKLPIKPSR